MRKLVYAITLAFSVGAVGFTANAAASCEFGSHAKKNDLEPPPPASAAAKQGT